MRPIILTGENVSLGVVLDSDAENAFIENNDPELNHYFRRLGRMSSYQDAVDSIKWLYKNSETERVLAIVLNQSGETIGHVGIHGIDWKSRNANVGYALFKEYWGKGYMTEAVALLVKYSFEMINLRKLFTHVLDPNIGSKRVLEKNGFKECGRLTEHSYVYDHGYVDEVLYELIRK